MPIRIVLADDHVLVRQGLKSLLERERFQVVAEASDGQEALGHGQSLEPDIAVIDSSMPTWNGLHAAREMGRCFPKTKTILLTRHDEAKGYSRGAGTRRQGIRRGKPGRQRFAAVASLLGI